MKLVANKVYRFLTKSELMDKFQLKYPSDQTNLGPVLTMHPDMLKCCGMSFKMLDEYMSETFRYIDGIQLFRFCGYTFGVDVLAPYDVLPKL